jgi:hypothetical protein
LEVTYVLESFVCCKKNIQNLIFVSLYLAIY